MAVGRVWDADNGVWQRIGGPPNVVDPVEPTSPVDGLIWTNPTDGVSKIWDADGDEWIVVGTGAGGGGGGGHVVDPVEPVAPEDGLIWVNPNENTTAEDISRLPKGVLGYVPNTGHAGISSEVDVSGMSITVTVPAGRRLRISYKAEIYAGGAFSTLRRYMIYADGVNIATSLTYCVGNSFNTGSVITIHAPSAGTHTYKIRASADAGTMDIQGGYGGFFLIEDIGAV